MKRKDLFVKMLDEIGSKTDTKNDEMFLALHQTGNAVSISIATESDARISALLSVMLLRQLQDKANKGVSRLANIILTSIKALMFQEYEGGKLLGELMELRADYYNDVLENVLESNDEHECKDCEFNRTCNDEAAIAYRKANGIKSPKRKNKKRKSHKGE